MDEGRTALPVRVLLCDDAADIRMLFRIELEAEGDIAVIALASTGEEAIDLARNARPDVTLIDLGLPGKSGLETIDDLVAEGIGGAIVVVSGAAGATPQRESLDRGAFAFVGKRAPAEELRKAVRQAARAAQGAGGDGR